MGPLPHSDLTRMWTKKRSTAGCRLSKIIFGSLGAEASMHFQRKLLQRLWFFKWLRGVKGGLLHCHSGTGRVVRVWNRKKEKKDEAWHWMGWKWVFVLYSYVDSIFLAEVEIDHSLLFGMLVKRNYFFTKDRPRRIFFIQLFVFCMGQKRPKFYRSIDSSWTKALIAKSKRKLHIFRVRYRWFDLTSRRWSQLRDRLAGVAN